jgi:flagellum-specific peptidoglycan hydrolase FlgJ
MSAGNVTNSSKAGFLQRNWFTIGIAVLLVFILLKKDLSFSINMRAPAEQHREAPVQKAKKEKVQELMTEAQPTSEKSKPQLFDLSVFRAKGQSNRALDKLLQTDDATVQAYLKRFARVAVSESAKFGIPASIILANAALQSRAGQHPIAQKGNNHFALPCTPDWKGANQETDGTCLRTYENAWTSFRDHSYYLTTGRMAGLKKLADANYKTWAKALENAEFSNDGDYAAQLMQVIEKYELVKLDE